MTFRFFLQKLLILNGKLRGFAYNLLPGVSVGLGTVIERGAKIRSYCRWGSGGVRIGKNCYIARGCEISPASGNIIIGDETTINPHCFVYGIANISIGKQVRIGAHCVIVAVNHNYEDLSKPICKQGVSGKGITIEQDVWIGAAAAILDGVVVKKGNVIGAGSVVTKTTEENGVYIGVPARRIKDR